MVMQFAYAYCLLSVSFSLKIISCVSFPTETVTSLPFLMPPDQILINCVAKWQLDILSLWIVCFVFHSFIQQVFVVHLLVFRIPIYRATIDILHKWHFGLFMEHFPQWCPESKRVSGLIKCCLNYLQLSYTVVGEFQPPLGHRLVGIWALFVRCFPSLLAWCGGARQLELLPCTVHTALLPVTLCLRNERRGSLHSLPTMGKCTKAFPPLVFTELQLYKKNKSQRYAT